MVRAGCLAYTANLTLTFGLRHSILPTPWETSGQQASPTIETHQWYLQREAAAQAGQIYQPNLQFAPAGKYYGKPAFWPKPKNNFAPRFSIAYSPDNKTSLRAGAGIYYDHYGEALVSIFDHEGSFGISSSVTNPGGIYLPFSPFTTLTSTLPSGDKALPQTPNPVPIFMTSSAVPPTIGTE